VIILAMCRTLLLKTWFTTLSASARSLLEIKTLRPHPSGTKSKSTDDLPAHRSLGLRAKTEKFS
jgi:hypothetical protein